MLSRQYRTPTQNQQQRARVQPVVTCQERTPIRLLRNNEGVQLNPKTAVSQPLERANNVHRPQQRVEKRSTSLLARRPSTAHKLQPFLSHRASRVARNLLPRNNPSRVRPLQSPRPQATRSQPNQTLTVEGAPALAI